MGIASGTSRALGPALCGVAIWVVMLMAAGRLSAAPQMLALVATGAPAPLQCTAEGCRVELPSLCLQPERRAPEAGRTYRPWRAAQIRVQGTAADGRTLSLALPEEATLSAARTHVAVRLSLPRRWLDRHFDGRARISVTGTAALLPVPAAGDRQPLAPQEAARAASDHATLAADVVASDLPRRTALQLSVQLINGLDDAASPEAQQRAWHAAVAGLPAAARRPEVLALARFQFAFCRYNAAHGLSAGLRSCLAAQQDGALEVLHGRYIDALAAGS